MDINVERLGWDEGQIVIVGPRFLGGPGSGNFGHEGRPGMVGGSGDGDGATLYHGSTETVVATILKEGIQPRPSVETTQPRVYMSTSLKEAEEYARQKASWTWVESGAPLATPVIFQVDIPTEYVGRLRIHAKESRPSHWPPLKEGETDTRVSYDERIKPEWITRVDVLPYQGKPGRRILSAIGQRIYVTIIITHDDLRTAASASSLHDVADSHVEDVAVAVRFAFAMGRKTLARRKPTEATADKVASVIERELLAVLPGTLARVAAAGARVGATLLGSRRVLGGKGSGNFGHAGRPGEVGGSASDGASQQSGWDAMTIDERRASTTFTRDKAVSSFGVTEHQQVTVTAPGGVNIAITTKYGESIELQEQRLQKLGVIDPNAFLQDYALMASGTSREGTIVIQGRADGVIIFFTSEKPRILMQRSFSRDGESLSVEHGFFTIENDRQGSGIGARMLVDSLDMYAKHGVEEVATTANIDIGGYAWARLGFRAADPDEFRDLVIERAAGLSDERFQAITQGVKEKGQGAPEWLAEQPEGKAILKGSSWQAVINMSINGPRLRTQLREKITKNKEKWKTVSR